MGAGGRGRGAETRAACEADIQEQAAKIDENMAKLERALAEGTEFFYKAETSRTSGIRTTTRKFKRGSNESLEWSEKWYRCMPDTVDPRGPKGK